MMPRLIAFFIFMVVIIFVLLSPADSIAQQTDADFLDALAEDTFNYLTSDWAVDHHLPWSWISDELSGGDYVNPTEIGLYMLAYVGAHAMERDWSPSLTQMRSELTATLTQLRNWQTGQQFVQHHGPNAYNKSVFYQWYWINYGRAPVVGRNEGTNQLIPSIDNGFMAASLLVIREYASLHQMPDVAELAGAILDDMRFHYWYNANTNWFMLGAPHNPAGGIPGDVFSNENRIINFMAYALGHITEAQFRDSLEALQQDPASYQDITVRKVAWDGSYFTYTAPGLFILEHETEYGRCTVDPATEAQIAYAIEQGYICWGVSDAFDIGLGDYIQQGALPTGMSEAPEAHTGVVTPHASALALNTRYSTEAVENLRCLAEIDGYHHPEYGFRDSVMADPDDPNFEQSSDRFSALSQLWLFTAIVNYETGIIWDMFYRDVGVQAAHAIMYVPRDEESAPCDANASLPPRPGDPPASWRGH